MKLLVVEDNRAIADMIAAHLRERHFMVDTVSTGEAALQAVSATAYDAVVLDLGLPDMDGLEVLRHLRTLDDPHKGVCRLPRIVVRRAGDFRIAQIGHGVAHQARGRIVGLRRLALPAPDQSVR